MNLCRLGTAPTDIRSEIEDLIRSLVPFDSIETEHIEFVKKWISSGAPLFRTKKPDVPDTHLVSYFLLVDSAKNTLLLVDHKKAGLWLPAGGHVEPNEHPGETVKREVVEELGVEGDFLMNDPIFLTVTKTVGQTAGHTDVSLWYVLRGKESHPYQFDHTEFKEIKWFFPQDIPYHRSDPHLKRCIEKLNSFKCLK
ncbi:MAG: NUDIX hydrolase [Chlamydiales bacterium]|nr:NUDIX hydrolase [Chlamydiales bacterium]